MPGTYDSEKRSITLNTELKHEPHLTIATLIHQVVRDLLSQNDTSQNNTNQNDSDQNSFALADFPELVDMAVVATGLGVLQSNVGFVSKSPPFWDSTLWMAMPRPFLDTQGLAYTSAIAAWCRNDKDPQWTNELPSPVRKPLRASLKYLFKTGDSFVQPSSSGKMLSSQSQDSWLKVADENSSSQQIIALRFLQFTGSTKGRATELLVEKLRSGHSGIVAHAISAADRLQECEAEVADELRLLIGHSVNQSDNEIRAKAMLALARHQQVDDASMDVAAKMLADNAKFVAFAGLFALGTLPSVPEHVIPPANKGFVRSLQACDYEFIGLYTAAFNRWLDDPATHFADLLREDSPEYLEIALESLQSARENVAAPV